MMVVKVDVIPFCLMALICCLGSASGLTVVRTHTCNFEPPGSSCGWTIPPPQSGGFSGITPARDSPLGPRVDANPGTSNGHYVYYYANQTLSVPDQVLLFPSHQFLCGLSFSYYVIGPLDLDIVRENLGVDMVYLSQGAANSSVLSDNNPSPWESVNYSYNTTLQLPSSGSSLYFEASDFDLGEAPPELANQELFLALDNVTITFCLPCDYDSLVESEAIIVGGPERIDLELRRVTSYQFNASTPACPNETLVFTMESVVPDNLTPVFDLNSASGQLLVDASGPNLDANGTSGFLNISVHVVNSNYTQISHPHLQIVIIPFTQPPTINHTAPHRIPVNISADFLYQFTTSSVLGQQLTFSQLSATPPELANDANITIFQHQTGVRVGGRIDILETLPAIIQRIVTPSLSIAISDAHGGVVFATTQLQINPSPPLFTLSHYTFDLAENTSRGLFLGPIWLIDPNGEQITAPTITDPNMLATAIFSVVGTHFTGTSDSEPESSAFSSYSLLVNYELDYEQREMLGFQLVAADVRDGSLQSTAMVNVRILPVNEYTPAFILPSLEVTVAENQPRRSLVAVVDAQDRDTGPDGIIDYAITGGNTDGYFAISGMGYGEIVVARTPINPHVYNLTITASDRGVPSRSATARVVVNVVATSDVNCTRGNYAPPQVSSSSPTTQTLPVNGTLTLTCSYSANPAVRGYKWTHNDRTLLVGDADPHYVVTNNSLSISSLNSTDAGLFYCNVTNQCGSSLHPFVIRLIDYPNPPGNIRIIDRPSPGNLVLAWELPTGATLPATEFYNTPVTGYAVEVWDTGKAVGYQEWLTIPTSSTTSATLTGLHPGVRYSVRVLARNQAGTTPSSPVEVTTNASVPSIDHLRATALPNNSILVEWGLQYTGGHPVSLFEVHVMLHRPRARSRRATPSSADLVYHVDAGAGRLVTRAVDAGHTYTISAMATNILGPSNNQLEDVFVGYTDLSSCDFELIGGVCAWNMNGGVVTRADDATPPLPTTDASGNSQGHYVYAQVSSASETLLVSYPKAGYSCGLTFSYYISGGGAPQLLLKTSSGATLWSSPPMGVSAAWEVVGLTNSHYLTSVVQEGLEFVLVTTGDGFVALDEVDVNFCLPCDFNTLEGSSGFELNYDNYSRVYLRTPHTIEIQAAIQECPNAVLNFSLDRIVPTAIQSSFSLGSQDGHNLTLAVDPISPSRVEPNSLGFLEVLVSVMNSDYRSPEQLISRVAAIEIFLAEVRENCTFTRMCQFEEGEEECARWRLGDDVRLVNVQETPFESSFTGSCLLASGSPSTEITIATSVINDDICAVSFAYAVSPPPVELVVTVDGLGSVWSTLAAPVVSGWANRTLQVDLQDVQIMENRSMSFVARFASAGSQYAVLDNITLHPCTDCATPVCTLTSCTLGQYYSLDHWSCLDCSPGYYCPDWRIFPKPCPPGTFSHSASAYSLDTCQACPVGSFAVQSGSMACHSCPVGYDCSNASGIPLASGCSATPPMGTTGATSTAEKITAAVVGLGLAMGLLLLLLCLFISCAAFWCWKRRQRRHRKKKDRRLMIASKSDNDLNLSMVRSGKRMMNPGGNSVRTMTSLLTDSDSLNYFEDNSWLETEELTTPKASTSGGRQQMVLHNVNFDDDTSGREQYEMQETQTKTAPQTNF